MVRCPSCFGLTFRSNRANGAQNQDPKQTIRPSSGKKSSGRTDAVSMKSSLKYKICSAISGMFHMTASIALELKTGSASSYPLKMTEWSTMTTCVVRSGKFRSRNSSRQGS